MSDTDLVKILFGKGLCCSFQDTLSPNYSSRYTILIRTATVEVLSGHVILEGNLTNMKDKQSFTVLATYYSVVS